MNFSYTTTTDEDRGLAHRVKQWNDPSAPPEGQPWTKETVFARMVGDMLLGLTREADTLTRREMMERLAHLDAAQLERLVLQIDKDKAGEGAAKPPTKEKDR